MTKQEVVFCKSVFEKVKYNFDEQEIWPSEEYYKNLSLIKIKTLKSNKKTIEKCIKESKGFLKLFKHHLFSDKFEMVDSENTSDFFKDRDLNSLFNLALNTPDKIIHSENRKYWEEVNQSNYKDEFELIGIDRFINPINYSKLLTANRNIELRRGSKFNFVDIFAPYFRETSRLEIYDRYLRNRKRGFTNLLKIIDLCKHLSKCELHTLDFKNDEKNKFDIEFEDLEKELKQRYGSKKIELYSGAPHRRKIITDDFEIRIDPGLDFVNEEFICDSNDVDIQIRKIDK